MPVQRIRIIKFHTLAYRLCKAIIAREAFQGIFHQLAYVRLEECTGIHSPIDHGRGCGPGVACDPRRPFGYTCCIVHHSRSRVGPDFVNELRVNLEPVRIVFHRPGERRSETVVHCSKGSPVGQPHPVPDMVHPTFAHLGVGRAHSVLLHHYQVHILHIGIVIGESPVHCRHFAHSLVPDKRPFPGFFYEFVFIFESVDIADHLSQPGSGDFAAQLLVGDFLFCRRLFSGTGNEQGNCQQRCEYSLDSHNLIIFVNNRRSDRVSYQYPSF